MPRGTALPVLIVAALLTLSSCHLSMYAQEGEGFLTETDLEAYIFDLIPTLPALTGLPVRTPHTTLTLTLTHRHGPVRFLTLAGWLPSYMCGIRRTSSPSTSSRPCAGSCSSSTDAGQVSPPPPPPAPPTRPWPRPSRFPF